MISLQTNGSYFPESDDLIRQSFTEEEIKSFETKWESIASDLLPEEAFLLRQELRHRKTEVLKEHQSMRELNQGSFQIRIKIKEQVTSANSSMDLFLNQMKTATQIRNDAAKEQKEVAVKIQSIKLFFKPFTPPLSVSIGSERKGEEKINKVIQEYESKQLENQVKSQFGPTSGKGVKFLNKFVFGEVPEDSQNPVRDRVVNAGVHVGYKEILPYFVGGLPVLCASIGSHVIGQAAKETAELVEPRLEKIRQNIAPVREFDHLYGEASEGGSVEDATYAVSAALKAVQLPADLYDAGKKALSSLALKACDKMGITDDKIMKGLETLSENEAIIQNQIF